MKVDDLLGIWKGSATIAPHARCYDVLVFKESGDGFLDLYDSVQGFSETFRWSLELPAVLRLVGKQLHHFDPQRQAFAERKTTLDANVPIHIDEEDSVTLGWMRILRLEERPWPSMSECYQFYRQDIPIHATFQAPCFVLPEEPIDYPFRGKALSDYLAEQLEAQQISVGPRQEVFMGCCYYRLVQMQGRELGLAVNGARNQGEWWLRIDRPPDGGAIEVELLHRLLHNILQGVEGLRNLQWQTEEEWRSHPPADE